MRNGCIGIFSTGGGGCCCVRRRFLGRPKVTSKGISSLSLLTTIYSTRTKSRKIIKVRTITLYMLGYAVSRCGRFPSRVHCIMCRKGPARCTIIASKTLLGELGNRFRSEAGTCTTTGTTVRIFDGCIGRNAGEALPKFGAGSFGCGFFVAPTTFGTRGLGFDGLRCRRCGKRMFFIS